MAGTEHRAIISVHQDKLLPILATTPGAIAPVQAGELNTAGGLQIISVGSAGAFTLAAPIPGQGAPSASAASGGATGVQGDDGKELTILSISAFAHVVTTPASKLRSNTATGNTLTFSTVGASVVLEAYNGIWYIIGTPNGVTLGGA